MYDVLIVGGGVSGSFFAMELCSAGMRVALLEAGSDLHADGFPETEMDANAQLYWGGGIEFTDDMGIGLLRPKAVGGGSIVNQALMDRFDEHALSGWRQASGIPDLTSEKLRPWYERAEGELSIQEIPERLWNGNVRNFREGMEKCGYHWAPLRRAQKDCRYHEMNDCVLCLNGCPIDSKQSMPVTVLKKARAQGLKLISRFEAEKLESLDGSVVVEGVHSDGRKERFTAKRAVLASGAIGNSKLLLRSGFASALPALGTSFWSHPQVMVLAQYDKPMDAFKGPFQAVKSDEPRFRKMGFKLENVFAQPVGIAMLLPGMGREHQELMGQMRKLACIEVAIQDTCPGRIRWKGGKISVDKTLNREDRKRLKTGLGIIEEVFQSTGAKRIITGTLPISLHLMGGCPIGTDASRSVVDPEFRLHGHRGIYVADSSVFPAAPGQNPSLTIMALSLKASRNLLKEAGHAA